MPENKDAKTDDIPKSKNSGAHGMLEMKDNEATGESETEDHKMNNILEGKGLPEFDSASRQLNTLKRLILSSLGMPSWIPDPADLVPVTKSCGCRLEMLDDHTILKYGPEIRLREAEAMIFVSQKTSIVCPKVIAAYVLDDCGYIVMSYEKGQSLSRFWSQASDTDRRKVTEQLRRYVNDMRQIEENYIGGFDRTECQAGEFMWDFDPNFKYGPYKDEDEFNAGIIRALYRRTAKEANISPESELYRKTRRKEKQMITSHRDHKIVFTHGDLCPVNILIKPDMTVVILDWESAGFYPEYWEWYKISWGGILEYFNMPGEQFSQPFKTETNNMLHVYQKIIG